jgi:hypothetical protein
MDVVDPVAAQLQLRITGGKCLIKESHEDPWSIFSFPSLVSLRFSDWS